MAVRPRFWLLPGSALLLVAVTAWDHGRVPVRRTGPETHDQLRYLPPALQFELFDEQNRPVRLQRYIGRHRILVAFYDGEQGADRDATLLMLRRHFSTLQKRDVMVVAVSGALPQQARRATQRGGKFPFPLLSDGGPSPLATHRGWGRWDAETKSTQDGLFLVDRAGRVAWSDGAPLSAKNPAGLIRRLVGR